MWCFMGGHILSKCHYLQHCMAQICVQNTITLCFINWRLMCMPGHLSFSVLLETHGTENKSEIIHFLVRCNIKVSATAWTWNLWSVIGENTPGLKQLTVRRCWKLLKTLSCHKSFSGRSSKWRPSFLCILCLRKPDI